MRYELSVLPDPNSYLANLRTAWDYLIQNDVSFQSMIGQHQMLFTSGGIHDCEYFLHWHRIFLLDVENRINDYWGTTDLAWPYYERSCACTGTIGPSYDYPALHCNGGRPGIGGANNVYNAGTPPQGCGGSFASCGNLNANIDSDISGIGPASFCLLSNTIEASPGNHNAHHNAVGGTLASGRAAESMMFFMIHTQIDAVWERWQGEDVARIAANAGIFPLPNFGTHVHTDVQQSNNMLYNGQCYNITYSHC